MKKYLCAVLCALLALTIPAAAETAGYPDVPDYEWFYGYVTELSIQGVVDGYPDGNFSYDWKELFPRRFLIAPDC